MEGATGVTLQSSGAESSLNDCKLLFTMFVLLQVYDFASVKHFELQSAAWKVKYK